ncbi:MAG TPA: hypothetical protein DCM08_05135 [Microscillaceae bacterium]|jgi:transcriptional regulator with GAF, ATPase, and Fis domain|nr:hypothetical protein [Microscillaceae bacterium]
MVSSTKQLSLEEIEFHEILIEFDNLLRKGFNKPLADFTNEVIQFIAEYAQAVQATFFVYLAENAHAQAYGLYGYALPKDLEPDIRPIGEDLVGQVLLDAKTISLTNIPLQTLKGSNVLPMRFACLALVPLVFNQEVVGVWEIVSLHVFSEQKLEQIQKMANNAAVLLQAALTNKKVLNLLAEFKQQTDKLQVQEKELLLQNKKLMEQKQIMQDNSNFFKNKELELLKTIQQLREEIEILKRQIAQSSS